MISLLFSAVAAFGAIPVFGQSPAAAPANQNSSAMPTYIEEFFLSEAVRNEDRGELQLTFAVDSRKQLGSNMALQLECGLTDRLQVSSEAPYGISAERDAETPAGWSSATVGFEYQFVRSRTFALTGGMEFGFPVNAKGERSWEPSVLAARSLGKLQLQGSLAAEIETEARSFAYNVAGVYPVRKNWFPTLEWNGRRLAGRNAFYLTPGLYRHFDHGLEVGVGIPLGIGGAAASAGIVAQLTWEFKEDRDRD